jgi:hypothetical protein
MYRSQGALDRERRYRLQYMTADRFVLVQDWLNKAGHIEMVKRGFNLPGHSQTSRFALTDKGESELQVKIGPLPTSKWTGAKKPYA